MKKLILVLFLSLPCMLSAAYLPGTADEAVITDQGGADRSKLAYRVKQMFDGGKLQGNLHPIVMPGVVALPDRVYAGGLIGGVKIQKNDDGTYHVSNIQVQHSYRIYDREKYVNYVAGSWARLGLIIALMFVAPLTAGFAIIGGLSVAQALLLTGLATAGMVTGGDVLGSYLGRKKAPSFGNTETTSADFALVKEE